jgi:hypothetical protein
MRLKLLSVVLLVSVLSQGCVTIRDKITCSAAGKLLAGAICSHTLTSETFDLTFDELVDMLEAQPERPDPKNSGVVLPARGAAIIMSDEDFGEFKTELESACRMLGRRCSYATRQMLQRLK